MGSKTPDNHLRSMRRPRVKRDTITRKASPLPGVHKRYKRTKDEKNTVQQDGNTATGTQHTKAVSVNEQSTSARRLIKNPGRTVHLPGNTHVEEVCGDDSVSDDVSMPSLDLDSRTSESQLSHDEVGRQYEVSPDETETWSQESTSDFSTPLEYSPVGFSVCPGTSVRTSDDCIPFDLNPLILDFNAMPEDCLFQSSFGYEFSGTNMADIDRVGNQYPQDQGTELLPKEFMNSQYMHPRFISRSYDLATDFENVQCKVRLDDSNDELTFAKWKPVATPEFGSSRSVPMATCPEGGENQSNNLSLELDSTCGSITGLSAQNIHLMEWILDGADELEDKQSISTAQSSPATDKGTGLEFACPFLKRFPIEHQKCGKYTLRRIKDVKQHILRQHCGPKIYCPRCYEKFDTFRARDDHLRLGSCISLPISRFHFSDDQRERLRDCGSRRSNDEDRWMDIWDLAFPESERPASPYIENSQLELISSFRRYCDDNAALHVAKVLKELHQSTTRPEELATMVQHIVRSLLNDFEHAS
ncbi:hypothetical protein F5Y16DRAFT_364848 [Xylariaceae sp. FL0255]|nr:hypothetical protein F5Y16DRAFT_364848 [Xylariaceae sp. FL0255]